MAAQVSPLNFAGRSSNPAPGRSVHITGMRMFRIQHGRITDTWVNYDKLGLLQQLGVVPRF
jgi:predicted ester cyclase